MFTKKLEDQFSADLLNTVKGILGEAKHEKECECEKCEEEDDEDEDEEENEKEDKKKEMKEGSVPTSDEPTEHDKKVAQKVRDLLAKEKKSMKEEKRGLWANIHAKRKRIKAGSGERMRKPGSKGAPTAADFKASQTEEVQIDELSDATLKSYSRKALDQSKTLTGDQKVKRQVGARNAIDRLGNNTLAKEEVEIEEASTAEKNKQYIEITHLLGHKRRVPVHPTNAYKALNRYRNDPSTKSARIVSEEIELEEGKMKDLVTKHMDAGHDYETALKKAKKDLDVPFEGPYRKPGVRKDQYGNVVKNVAKHLAKKAMAKEEVEQIDEIGDTPAGKRALGRYIKDRRGTILGAGMGMERQNKDRSTTDKQRKDLGRKASNAFTGVARAVDRLTKEEVEQLDELSPKTLSSYAKKAVNQTFSKGVAGGMALASSDKDTEAQGHKLVNKAVKRMQGAQKAISKLTKEEQEFIDALNDADIDQIDENAWNQLGQKKPVGNTLPAPAKGSVPKHGRKFSEGDHVVPHTGPYAGQVHRVTSSRSGSVNIVRPNTPKYDSVTVRAKHEHLSPATPEQTAKYKAEREAEHKRMFGEEAEQIDEISAEKLVRYKDAAYKDSHKREKGISRALSKLVGGAKTKVWSDGRKNPVKEEVELEEGRGRPPKEGTPAWHARQKQANDDMVALGVQLRKAKSMNKKVRFMNGKEHEIHPSHIDKFEDHMAARKTSQDKAAFQKQAHKSHEDFVKAVTAPVPKASKDTGEIVKYRH